MLGLGSALCGRWIRSNLSGDLCNNWIPKLEYFAFKSAALSCAVFYYNYYLSRPQRSFVIWWSAHVTQKRKRQDNAIKKTHEGGTKCKILSIYSDFSLKMGCINESDSKFILNQINLQLQWGLPALYLILVKVWEISPNTVGARNPNAWSWKPFEIWTYWCPDFKWLGIQNFGSSYIYCIAMVPNNWNLNKKWRLANLAASLDLSVYKNDFFAYNSLG